MKIVGIPCAALLLLVGSVVAETDESINSVTDVTRHTDAPPGTVGQGGTIAMAQIGLGDFSGSENVITFDELGGVVPPVGPFSINDVTFSEASGGTGGPGWRLLDFDFPGPPLPQILTDNAGISDIRIDFAVPQHRAGVFVGVGPATYELVAYDESGNVLEAARVVIVDDAGGAFLGFENMAGIARLRVLEPSGENGRVGGIDDLHYERIDPCDNCPCPEDINRDGVVDFADILAILAAWGPCVEDCDDCEDGTVDRCGNPDECMFCQTPDGDCLCVFVGDRLCDDFQLCDGGRCPSGFFCCVNTCCAEPICMPLCETAAPVFDESPPPAGLTPAGMRATGAPYGPPSLGMLADGRQDATGPHDRWPAPAPAPIVVRDLGDAVDGTGLNAADDRPGVRPDVRRTAAPAAVFEIGPFAGDIAESWEGFLNYQENPDTYESSPASIFGGAALISNEVMAVYEPDAGATFGLSSSGSAQVADGTKGMGIDSQGMARIVFDVPVVDFGAYWGATTSFSDPSVVEVFFYDPGGASIGVAFFEYSRSEFGDGLLEWHGWHSDTPIGSIEYFGDYVVEDAMQANFETPGDAKWCNGPYDCEINTCYFSNVNSAHSPFIRFDDFVCTETGEVVDVEFIAGGFDVLEFVPCDLFRNLEAVEVTIHEWIPDDRCDWLPGPILLRNVIPVQDFEIEPYCIDRFGIQQYYFHGYLPERFRQVEGRRYGIRIAGILANPENPCVFCWGATSIPRVCLGQGFDRETGAFCVDLEDHFFCLTTEPPDPCDDCPCPADVNRDGVVDFADINKLLAAWGPCPDECDDCEDGTVDSCGGTEECHDCITPDGECVCVIGQSCDDNFACPDGRCQSGFFCCVNTCCGFPICLPICAMDGEAPQFEPGVLTSGGIAR